MTESNIENFIINNKKYEVYFCDNGAVEVYRLDNISKTGFIFNDIKQFTLFVNSITDVLEKYKMEND